MLRIRVDDFPFTKPEEAHRHNLDSFKKFYALFEKRGLEFFLGIIPKHTTNEQYEFLKNTPLVVPALHGVNHDERFPNEFREWQTKRDKVTILRAVKRTVESLVSKRVLAYIPPHNVIDNTTTSALIESGFTTLLVGPGADKEVTQRAKEIGMEVVYSDSPFFYGRSDEIIERGGIDVLRLAKDSKENQFLCIHFTWETNIGLESLEELLRKVFD